MIPADVTSGEGTNRRYSKYEIQSKKRLEILKVKEVD